METSCSRLLCTAWSKTWETWFMLNSMMCWRKTISIPRCRSRWAIWDYLPRKHSRLKICRSTRMTARKAIACCCPWSFRRKSQNSSLMLSSQNRLALTSSQSHWRLARDIIWAQESSSLESLRQIMTEISTKLISTAPSKTLLILRYQSKRQGSSSIKLCFLLGSNF